MAKCPYPRSLAKSLLAALSTSDERKATSLVVGLASGWKYRSRIRKRTSSPKEMASDGVNVGDLASPVVDYDEVYGFGDNADENTLTESHPNKEQSEVPTATDSVHKEDPRFRNGVKKLVKKGGVGRNT